MALRASLSGEDKAPPALFVRCAVERPRLPALPQCLRVYDALLCVHRGSEKDRPSEADLAA